MKRKRGGQESVQHAQSQSQLEFYPIREVNRFKIGDRVECREGGQGCVALTSEIISPSPSPPATSAAAELSEPIAEREDDEEEDDCAEGGDDEELSPPVATT
jgi:hypothetical protein